MIPRRDGTAPLLREGVTARPEEPVMKRWVKGLWRPRGGAANVEWVFVASVLALGSAAALLAIRYALLGD
jgi:hypothetical protein